MAALELQESEPPILSAIAGLVSCAFPMADEAAAPPVDAALRREVLRWVARRLELAFRSLQQGRYEDGVRSCRRILALDPDYSPARHLVAVAERDLLRLLSHPQGWTEDLRAATEDDPADPRIPEEDGFRFPSRSEWDRFLLGREKPPGPEDPAALQVRLRLGLVRVSLDLVDVPFEVVLAMLRDCAGVPILLDAELRDRVDPEARISVQFRNKVLQDALSETLSRMWTGLRHEVTDEGVVLITDRPDPDRY